MGTISEYEQDLFAWAERNAGLIRQGRYEELDYLHLAEELEEFMGNTRRELYRRLRILLAHLLKWRYQPEGRSSSWAGTIRTQRSDLARLLKQNPSLQRFVAEEMDEAYGDARELAATETGKPLEVFPDHCPFPADQVLDKGFWPEVD
ncbi:MAG: DUF29 domain-containing protein [Candidatus Competibacteraceae bacterium]|nr:DUF29 domain-containing protein [Candidatus Competibacteraceae bacterium]